MTATNKVTRIFTYLADHGETPRWRLMQVVGTDSVTYFQTLMNELRKTQGVYTKNIPVIVGRVNKIDVRYVLNPNGLNKGQYDYREEEK